MQGYLKLCNAVYWLSLTVWLAALVSAGIAAMHVFGTLGEMPMQLEQYSAYPAEEHGSLAAGHIMDGVFFTVDVLQFVAAPLTVLMLLSQFVLFRLPCNRPAAVIRTACVIIAAGLFAYHATALAPTMNRELRAHWAAAEAGDVAEAHEHQQAFIAYHPAAGAILKANMILLLVAVGASAASLSSLIKPKSSLLEKPKLLTYL